MDEDMLIELGFAKNEARVYSVLIREKNCSAHKIISLAKMHKSMVYDNLNKLIDKGLVYSIVEGRTTLFSIAQNDSLVNYFEEKEKEIANKKQKAIEIQNIIRDNLSIKNTEQVAMLYRGVSGIKSFLREFYNLKEEYYVIGAPKESVEVMGDVFWENHSKKMSKNRVHGKMIFNSSLREFSKRHDKRYTEIKFFEGSFEPLTEIIISGENVATLIWTKDPALFLLKDKHAAEAYKRYFEELWKVAKK